MDFIKKNLLCFIPIFFSLSLLIIYISNHKFYLHYILSGLNRESQAVEMLTFSCALLSSLVLFKNAWSLINQKEYTFSMYTILLLAAASFFLAGEESSWGQSYFFWKTPEIYDTTSLETNLHNTDIPVQSLGSLFLLCYFVFLPLIWKKIKFFKINKSIGLAIAEPQIIFCLVYAFLWKSIKSFYKVFYSKEFLETNKFFMEFVEQINEQKEFLVVIAITIYAFSIDLKVAKIK